MKKRWIKGFVESIALNAGSLNLTSFLIAYPVLKQETLFSLVKNTGKRQWNIGRYCRHTPHLTM
jgi:hypothetical protein